MNRLISAGSDADNGQLGTAQLGESLRIAAGFHRKILVFADLVGWREPTGHRRIDWAASGKFPGIGGWCVEHRSFPIDTVAGADGNFGNTVKAVEISDGQLIHTIDHRGIAGGYGIKPAAAAGPSGGGAKLAPHPVQHLSEGVILRGQRPFAHARGVGLHDPDHRIDPVGSHTRAGAGSA